MKMIAEASAGRPFHLPPITDPRRRVPLGWAGLAALGASMRHHPGLSV